MTKQHKATPEQWTDTEDWAAGNLPCYSCILELRDRIETLEATQHAHVGTSHLTEAEREQIQEELARPATFAELLMPPPHTITPIRTFTATEAAPFVAPSSPANSLVDRVASDAELCKVYNDAPDQKFGPALRAVYDLGRQHGAAPIRSGPESPLVERVADAIAAQATSAGIVNDRPARAAILEVAAWMREQRDLIAATALTKEANRTTSQED